MSTFSFSILLIRKNFEEILRLAGIHDYLINKNPDKEDGDFAILLSESKVMMDSMMSSRLPIGVGTSVSGIQYSVPLDLSKHV